MLINEIFTSIDGEVNKWGQGVLTTFIRLQGCNLRCSYCDTPKSLPTNGGAFLSLEDILSEVKIACCKKVTITGGEPLYQYQVFDLIDLLMKYKYNISIETNGTHRIPIVYLGVENINWIVDYKWEYKDKMILDYKTLSKTDWIKFLVNENNVMEIFNKIKEMRKEGVHAKIAVSDVNSSHVWLMNLLIKERIFDVSLNIQLHKLIDVR